MATNMSQLCQGATCSAVPSYCILMLWHENMQQHQLASSSHWLTCLAAVSPSAHPRVMCALQFLLSKGFKTVKNVTGGIAAYSMIDRNVPEY